MHLVPDGAARGHRRGDDVTRAAVPRLRPADGGRGHRAERRARARRGGGGRRRGGGRAWRFGAAATLAVVAIVAALALSDAVAGGRGDRRAWRPPRYLCCGTPRADRCRVGADDADGAWRAWSVRRDRARRDHPARPAVGAAGGAAGRRRGLRDRRSTGTPADRRTRRPATLTNPMTGVKPDRAQLDRPTAGLRARRRRVRRPQPPAGPGNRLFGGLIAAQSLAAAGATVEPGQASAVAAPLLRARRRVRRRRRTERRPHPRRPVVRHPAGHRRAARQDHPRDDRVVPPARGPAPTGTRAPPPGVEFDDGRAQGARPGVRRPLRDPRPRPATTRRSRCRRSGSGPGTASRTDPLIRACTLTFMSDFGPVPVARPPDAPADARRRLRGQPRPRGVVPPPVRARTTGIATRSGR